MQEKARYAHALASNEGMSMQGNYLQDDGAHLERRGG